MQNYYWYFVTTVVWNKIWKLPKTQMIILGSKFRMEYLVSIGQGSFFIRTLFTSLASPVLGRQEAVPLKICFTLQIRGWVYF